MKYLVDKKTKEHRPYYGGSIEWAEDQGLDIVRADFEGWIKHEGRECPLPEDVPCQVRIKNGSGHSHVREACGWDWAHDNYNAITHYRPVLTEKVQEPEQTECVRCGAGGIAAHTPHCTERMKDLLDRLKAAHAQAQQIPDLEAELREVLGSMGYTLGKLSPFVPAEFVDAEPAVETPQGYTLVPVEPTHKMLDALYNFIPGKYADKAGETMAYKSMLRIAAQYPEPVLQDRVIAGALFDFLGFLTTRDKPTSFGSTRNASPAVELLQEWADKRGLDLKGADVENWHSRPKGEK